jgi:predicted acetyltransferase
LNPGKAARLAAPSVAFKQSFIEAVREFQADDYPWNAGSMGRYREVDVDVLERDFASFLAGLEDAAGRSVQPGLVPQTSNWLVEDTAFIGRVSVRHRLNENLMRVGGHIGYEIRPSRRRQGYGTLALRLGLEKAKALGIRRALVTCDATNGPSRSIILANGGKMEDEIEMGEGKPAKQRFWIDLS